MVFESRIAASRSMLNVDVLSKVGFLVVLEAERVAVDTQKLLPHLDQWVLVALLEDLGDQVAHLSEEAGLVEEVVDSEVDLNNVEAMEEAVEEDVVGLAFKEAEASTTTTEDKMVTAPLPLTLQLVQVVVAVGSLEVEEDTAVPVHQIATALEVGTNLVEADDHSKTEMEEVADIVATAMVLRVVDLAATWSR